MDLAPFEVDRAQIRSARRIRNKEKREQKKAEHKNEREKKINDLKYKQSQNHSIAIVSKEFVENFRSKQNNEAKTKKLAINLTEVINFDKTNVREAPKANENVKIEGDPADSNEIVRHKGKQRELPKKKPLSKIKKDLALNENAGKEIMEICDNVISEELIHYSEELIKRIVELQEKLYKRDPQKGAYKRKFVVGFHQLRKFLLAKRVKLIFIAIDLKIYKEIDVLYELIKETLHAAELNNILHVFVFKRRKLGKLTLKHVPVSCIGVLDIDGAHEEFKQLTSEINKCKKIYLENSSNIHINDEINTNLIIKLQDALKCNDDI